MSESEPPEDPRITPPDPKDVDIGALLTVALGAPPPERLADKVGAKLTLMTTIADFALMMFAAPFDWMREDPQPAPREATTDEPTS